VQEVTVRTRRTTRGRRRGALPACATMKPPDTPDSQNSTYVEFLLATLLGVPGGVGNRVVCGDGYRSPDPAPPPRCERGKGMQLRAANPSTSCLHEVSLLPRCGASESVHGTDALYARGPGALVAVGGARDLYIGNVARLQTQLLHASARSKH
jgi:hypothetical protein